VALTREVGAFSIAFQFVVGELKAHKNIFSIFS
jgi:hypothetical protein